MKYLAIDLGSRKVGLAVSDQLGIIATSYKVIKHEEEYDKVVLLIKEEVENLKVDALVLGLPKNMNNSLGEKANLSLKFKEKLEKQINIEVFLEDERLSTKSAHDVMIKGNVSRKKRKEKVDALAATIFLQSFLDKR